jgi:hypothetical protein
MKTLGFQTLLCNPEAEPRGIQLIKSVSKNYPFKKSFSSIKPYNFFLNETSQNGKILANSNIDKSGINIIFFHQQNSIPLIIGMRKRNL